MDITTLIQQNPVYIGIAIFFGAIGLAVNTAKQILSFYEDHLISRSLKRIDNLSKSIPSDSEVHTYLNSMKESEVFRLVSGINVNTNESSLLMQLHNDGYVNKSQLKKIYPYVKLDENNKVSIQIPFSQQLLIAYSFVSAIYIFLLGLTFGLPFIASDEGSKSLAGISIVLICAFSARFLGKDFRAYGLLKKLRDNLKTSNKLSPKHHWNNNRAKALWKKIKHAKNS